MGVPLNVTEWIKGYVGFGATDADAGFIQGIQEGTYFEHEVLIEMDDIDRFVAEPTHTAKMRGYVLCDRLGGKRTFENGTFNMLVDSAQPGLKFMFYLMPFTDASGKPYTMLGHKTIHDDHAFDLWSDITTLAIRIFEGDVKGPDMTSLAMGPSDFDGKTPIAMGMLHIQILDGIKSAASFTSSAKNPLDGIAAVEKFGAFYLDRLWKIFGKAHPSQR